MRFSTGLLDSLFGKKVTMTVPGPDGSPITQTVTKKWLEQLQASGLVTPTGDRFVEVHMLGLAGYAVEQWKLGEDIDEDTWSKFRDPKTGAVYAMTHLNGGKPETHILAQEMWMQLKRQLDGVDG